jgi:predicted CXXCH cytochrome family protein
MAAKKLLPAAAAALLSLAAPAFAGPPKRSQAPVPAEEAVSTHGPFEAGECGTCHDLKDPAGPPGRLLKATGALCFDCHGEFRKPVKSHPRAKGDCTGCHSPHNAKKPKLLW